MRGGGAGNTNIFGQPGYNSGDRAAVLVLARKLLAEFEAFDYVVTPSGSCAGNAIVSAHFRNGSSGKWTRNGRTSHSESRSARE